MQPREPSVQVQQPAGKSPRQAIEAFERDRCFWNRFGLAAGQPDFTDMKVLEIGSGRGERCLEIAYRGARRVVGLDTFPARVKIATAALADHTDIAPIVQYQVSTIHDLEEDGFDAVVSENTFEHIVDLPETLAAIRSRLSPGGRVFLGFGPLWHGPSGDHGWIRQVLPFGGRILLPWGHVLCPRQWALRRVERLTGKPAKDMIDWPYDPLNEKTAAEFDRLFRASGLHVRVFLTNANMSWKGKSFGSLAGLPFVGKYFTLGIYSILEA
jgi:SAM-dependent methyltransferase